MNTTKKSTILLAASLLLLAGVGCETKPSVLTSDPALKRTSAQFAADSAKRFPYKADAPKGEGEIARAIPDYSMDHVDVANLSGHDLTDVEIWINKQYVVSVPTIKKGDLKRVNFRMFYDDKGTHFTLKNRPGQGGEIINTLEIYTDGKMWNVPIRLGL